MSGLFAPAEALDKAGNIANLRKDIVTGVDKFIVKADAEDPKWLKALSETGIDTELIQDNIANLAHSDYAQYIKYKQQVLSLIRSKTIETYVQTKSIYMNLGYSEDKADKIASETAKDIKSSWMKIYTTLFPHSGKKIEKVY